MIQGVIYKLTNKINGLSYIGQTTNLTKRLRDHRYNAKHMYKSNAGQRIVQAIREFGFENFEVSILFQSNLCDDKQQLRKLLYEKEIFFISKYDTINNGYNITKGGAGLKGYLLPKDKIESIRASNLGRKHSEEFRENARQRFKKLWENESFRKRRSEMTSGKNNPMYGIRLTGEQNPNFGKHMSEETKRKLSESRKGKGHPTSEETKKKLSEILKGRPKSEEQKRKLREYFLGRPNVKKRKKVYQYTKEGDFVKEWSGISEAENALGIKHVGCCALGKRPTAGGFQWRFTKD